MKIKKLLLTAIAIFGFAIITIAQVPPYVPTSGLQGWWPFNGNANDESGNGNNGTNNGATLTADRNSISNSAYHFDGSSYLDLPSLNFTGDFSVSLWLNADTLFTEVCGQHEVLSKIANGLGWPNGHVLGVNELGGFSVGNGSVGTPPSLYTCSVHNWYHITYVYTFTSQTMQLYCKDSLISTKTPFVVNNFTVPIRLAARPNSVAPFCFFTGKIDDIGIWNRALTQQEITDLYIACNGISFLTQPNNQTVNITDNAQFITISSDTSATYQWETNLGLGWQTVFNAGQYSGATNDTLIISNTTLANNNQNFRCITTVSPCADTSTVAILTVIDNTGISESLSQNKFKLYPNPATNQINVKINANLIGSIYSITDQLGKTILTGKLNAENSMIELGNLSGGVYVFSIGENAKQAFKIIKQ